MKNMLVALVALALLPATTFAGGGTKGTNSKLVINNLNGSQRLAIIVDAPAGFDPKKNTVSQFTNAGGKIIEAGGSLTLNLKEGKHQFGAAFVNSNGQIGKNFTNSYNLPKNSTTTVDVSGAYPEAPTIVITSSTSSN